MATRSRLASERLALLMLDMQLRYGQVVRERPATLHVDGRCIACGQVILRGTTCYSARWEKRPTAGFYAHDTCPPLESPWLADDSEYTQVFDYSVPSLQRCARCRVRNADVRIVVPAPPERFTRGGIVLNYVCSPCVLRPTRRRTGE